MRGAPWPSRSNGPIRAHSYFVARAYLTLGRALSAQGKSGDARAALASALQHFESTLGEDHPETRSARQLLASVHDDKP